MKLYVTRHGRTNYNDLRLCNDDPAIDVHLTEVGKTQAGRVAESLRQVSLDKIIVSPLPRTLETATIINAYHNSPIEVDERTTDIHNGFEGRPAPDYHAALNTADDAWAYKFDHVGESLNEQRTRVAHFLDELKQQDHENVLIVTHQGTLLMLAGIIFDLDHGGIEAFDILQGEFVVFEV